jgi:hypothetical protein
MGIDDRVAWLLNFAAEVELEHPARQPSAAVRARLSELVPRTGALVRPGDVVLLGEGAEALPAGMRGRAWCPTPRAIAMLLAAGAAPGPVPAFDVLRAVNHRRFALALGEALPGQCWVTSLDEVMNAVERPSPTGSWLLKRPHAFAGRGRRRVRPGEVLGAARAWIEASLRGGAGLVCEPWVERAGDFGVHGFVRPGGALVLGDPTVQATTPEGAWEHSRRARGGELSAEEETLLEGTARAAAAALVGAGYFGPFGVDAFRWRDEHGEMRFNPRCEVNARYTMGWAVGMGERRPDLSE